MGGAWDIVCGLSNFHFWRLKQFFSAIEVPHISTSQQFSAPLCHFACPTQSPERIGKVAWNFAVAKARRKE